MLRVRCHEVEDYEQLLGIDAGGVGTMSESDRECLGEVGNFLASTDGWRRFALWMLHKHFEPQHAELFVERVIVDEKRTETSSVGRSTLGRQVSPVAICFRDGSGPAPQVVGLEYAELHPWEPTAALDDQDQPVLAGIAHRLREHGKLDRFGVRLIRNPLAMTPSEILLETCDSSTRTIHCHVASRSELPANLAAIETAWRWRVVGGASRPVVTQDCSASCNILTAAHPSREGILAPQTSTTIRPNSAT
jgi:hypothetical protein